MATDAIHKERGSHWSWQHFNILLWRQLDGCSVTRPFLSAKGVACEYIYWIHLHFDEVVDLGRLCDANYPLPSGTRLAFSATVTLHMLHPFTVTAQDLSTPPSMPSSRAQSL